MATEPPRKRLCKEAVCSVCPNYSRNPVTTIVECRHSFCSAGLAQCWRESEQSCPLCQENVQTREKCLKIVRDEKKKILAHKAHIRKESQDLLEQTKSETRKTVVEFGKLRQFLMEQEKLMLGKMALLEKEIARERDERLARLSSDLSCLESLIRDMEEKQQQPGIELLQ